MQIQGFYPDIDNMFERFTDNETENTGFVDRMNLFSKKETKAGVTERVWSDKPVFPKFIYSKRNLANIFFPILATGISLRKFTNRFQ